MLIEGLRSSSEVLSFDSSPAVLLHIMQLPSSQTGQFITETEKGYKAAIRSGQELSGFTLTISDGL